MYSKKERRYLIIVPESGLFVSDSDYDAVELSHLGRTLRSKLTNQHIQSIKQHDNDRIIEIETEDFILVLEFFRKGNVILTQKPDKNIILAKEMRTWSHRIIKPKHSYKYPPPSKYKMPVSLEEELKKLGDANQKLKTEYDDIYQKYKTKPQKKRREKIQKIQKSRLLKLKELAQEKAKLQKYVDSIYIKYADFEGEFERIKEKKKHGTAEVIDVPLDVKKSLSQNIQDFFGKIKKVKRKINGLKKSIEEAEFWEQEAKPKPTKQQEAPKQWYEKFRWFVSSDDFLVVAGKDAKSNEQLIRRHMKPKDLVFHTDITGSPFVLVKNPDGKQIPESTINEAAEFCASYSKAWKIGMSIADVYHVNPDKVKKEGGLPTGSFMIYGKRNWIRRISLEVTIGIDNGRVICGPRSAVSRKTKEHFSVTPSEESFKVPEKFKEFEDEILRVIPYGKAILKESKNRKR